MFDFHILWSWPVLFKILNTGHQRSEINIHPTSFPCSEVAFIRLPLPPSRYLVLLYKGACLVKSTKAVSGQICRREGMVT